MSSEIDQSSGELQPNGQRSPIGGAGADTDRDPQTGRFVRGNRASLVVGERSGQFWESVEDARREIVAGVLADQGVTDADASLTLKTAANGLAQSVLIRDAAFARIAASQGPLTSSDRERRAFNIWQAASARVDALIKTIGFTRVPKNVNPDFSTMTPEQYAAWEDRQQAQAAEREQDAKHG